MLKLFREAGVPRRTPPQLPACDSEDGSEPPRITSPLLNVTYTLQRSKPERVIALESNTAADVQNVFWFDGGALLAKQPVGAGAFPWHPTAEGEHLIRAIDDHGRSAEREIRVQFAP